MSQNVAIDPGTGGPKWLADAEALPADAGSYLLLVRLAMPLLVQRPFELRLDAGWYLYAGSGRGPGGVRARARRHLKRDKKVQWHIDQLTSEAEQVLVAAFGDKGECDLVRGLLADPAIIVPADGFGSSDCKRCRSHLLYRTS